MSIDKTFNGSSHFEAEVNKTTKKAKIKGLVNTYILGHPFSKKREHNFATISVLVISLKLGEGFSVLECTC